MKEELQDLMDQIKEIKLNQIVLFKKLCKIEDKLEGSSKLANYSSYVRDLEEEKKKLKNNW